MRPAKNDQLVPIVADQRSSDEKIRLLQVWPGAKSPLPLTDYQANLSFWGVDLNRDTVYFSAQGMDYSHVSFYRTHDGSPKVQLMMQNIFNITLMLPMERWVMSSDFQWMVYNQPKPDGTWSYWVTHLPTLQSHNVSDWIAPNELLDSSDIWVTQDGRWLVALSRDTNIGQANFLRVDLHNGQWQRLAELQDQPRVLGVRGQVGQWIIVETDQGVYRLALDGSDFEPLIADPFDSYETIVIRDESSGLVVIRRENLTSGVEVATQKIIWQYDDLDLGYVTTSDNGWVLASHNHQDVRIHLPTGEIQPLPDTLDPLQTYLIAESPDDQWLLYGTLNAARDTTLEWRRFNWATYTTELIRQPRPDFYLLAISPDGNWLWVRSAETSLYRIRVADGHLEYILKGGSYAIAGWMWPYVRAWHPTPLLLIGAGLILLGFFPHRLTRLPRRTLSTSRGH